MFRLIFKKVASVFFIFQNIFSLSQLGLKVLKIYLLYGQWWSGSCKKCQIRLRKKGRDSFSFFYNGEKCKMWEIEPVTSGSILNLHLTVWISEFKPVCSWKSTISECPYTWVWPPAVPYVRLAGLTPSCALYLSLSRMARSSWLVWPTAVPYTWVWLG